ncbi:F-box/LRR-repeat protein 14 isoform X2 [Ceratitis capitata]|uniref:F-box/LRR-repeat protein 14 isoform X2 n=1 Tax=Ceratitis capitata TaxID=7213 RepID=UPI0003298243|nr:F-box/LRR-repeat protein 14 isoform X2 [Ceratitis capitata]
MMEIDAKDFRPAANIEGNRNFYVRDNKAYTEDNVLVQNIFVYKIPNKVTQESIRNYFHKFGPLLYVRVVQDKKRARRGVPKVAFVNYAKPEHACNVLQKPHHFVNNLRVSVKASDSWNQPEADKAGSTVQMNNDSINIPPGFHMLSMNDDCLEMICNLLMLSDQMRFARVCRRFQDIFENICKREFKTLHLDNLSRLTLWEKRDFLRLAGKNILYLRGNIPYQKKDRVLEFICTSCPNLQRIAFDNTKLRTGDIKKFVSSFPQLREFSLSGCGVSDEALRQLKNCKNLRSVNILGNYEITGKYIKEMLQIEELSINGCNNINLITLQEICIALTKLSSLDIRRYQRVNSQFVAALSTNSKNLEVLKMSAPDVFYEQISLLPQLKHLELLCRIQSPLNQDQLMSSLVTHKRDQLEVLKLSNAALSDQQINSISELKHLRTLHITRSNFIDDSALLKFSKLEQLEELTVRGCNVTDSGVMTMLKKCTKLRTINVQSCKRITEKLVNDAIEFLQKNRDRELPLILYVYNTSIQTYTLSELVFVRTRETVCQIEEDTQLLSIIFLS